MDFRALSFRQVPHQPKLFLDYLDHFEKVKSFYVHPPAMTAVTRAARKLDYPDDRRAEVVSILREQNIALGAGAETLSNLDRLEKGTVAVVSGQQVGLFSGPAYSVYKALTAIQIAEELTQSGIPAVPVFWMATEDHDLDEVRHTTWFDQGKLVRFELPVAAEVGRPVGQIPLGAQIEPLVQEAAEMLANQGSDLLAQYLIESYRPEETYGSAFGKLFARLFAQHGLILMDPLDGGLHKVAAPLYQHALAERDTLNEKLLQRGKELERAGFEATVKVTSKSALLFSLKDGSRQAITASSQEFLAGDKSWPREELVQLTHREPEDFERDQKQIAEMLTKLGEKIEALDPTLKNTVEKTREGIEFHLDKLRRKAGIALDQKAGLVAAHEQHLESLLNPHKVLQERELCLLPFLARWGAGGLSELQKLAMGKKIGHHFIIQVP